MKGKHKMMLLKKLIKQQNNLAGDLSNLLKNNDSTLQDIYNVTFYLNKVSNDLQTILKREDIIHPDIDNAQKPKFAKAFEKFENSNNMGEFLLTFFETYGRSVIYQYETDTSYRLKDNPFMKDWESLTKNEKIEHLESTSFDATSDFFTDIRRNILYGARYSLPYMDQDQIDYFSQNCFTFCKFIVDLQNQRNDVTPEIPYFAELYHPSVGEVYEKELAETVGSVNAESDFLYIKEVIFPGIIYPNLDFSENKMYTNYSFSAFWEERPQIKSLIHNLKAIVTVE